MSELTELGYPEGYHMGFSAIIWWITIVIIAILSIILYLKSKKSDLINVKEMLKAKSFSYICQSIQFSIINIGVYFPDIFIQLFLFGLSLNVISFAFYMYYWEKNLTSIKHIPTICAVGSAMLAIILLTLSIIFPELTSFLWDLLFFTGVVLTTIALILYIYLIFMFSKNVRGISIKIGVIWMIGMVLIIIHSSFEYPPGVKAISPLIIFYITPMLFIIGLTIAFYGVTTLFRQISTYYAQTQQCAVHRGLIEKGSIVYYCPSCGITYCESCFNKVIKKDGCWNCRHGVELEIEKGWKPELAVEVEKITKIKPKN